MLSGRLVKWSVELSEFDLQYCPHPAIKSQIFANFVAECTPPEEDPKVVQDLPIEGTTEEPMSEMSSWTLYIDRSSTTMAGAGIVFISSKDVTLEYAL